MTLHETALYEALDLNSNGALGWPDLMGWVMFGTVGVLSLAVTVGLVVMLIVGVGRGLRASTRWMTPHR